MFGDALFSFVESSRLRIVHLEPGKYWYSNYECAAVACTVIGCVKTMMID